MPSRSLSQFTTESDSPLVQDELVLNYKQLLCIYKNALNCTFIFKCIWTKAWCPYLFNVQEVFGFEGYGHALHRNVIAGAGVVTNICPHSKRHRFGLNQWRRGLPVSKHNRDYHSIKAVEETTVDPWPLPSQAWRGPVCQPPSSEPPGPPPRTRLSPMAGWCRSLRSPEMHKEFT